MFFSPTGARVPKFLVSPDQIKLFDWWYKKFWYPYFRISKKMIFYNDHYINDCKNSTILYRHIMMYNICLYNIVLFFSGTKYFSDILSFYLTFFFLIIHSCCIIHVPSESITTHLAPPRSNTLKSDNFQSITIFFIRY